MVKKSKRKKQPELSSGFCEKVIGSILSGVLILDFKGKVLWGNKAVAKIMGFKSAKEAIGQHVFKYIAPKSKTSVIRDLINVRRGRGGYLNTYRVFTKGGEEIWIEGLGSKITFGGKPANLVTIRDITERKQAEEKLKRAHKLNREIIEKAPFGIYVVNKEGGIDYVNQVMLKISGDTRKKFMKINALKLLTYKKIGLSNKIEAGLKGKYFKTGPIEYTSYIGKKTTTRQFTGIPLVEDQIRKLIVVVEDITERKRAEEEIRKFKTIADEANYGIAMSDLDERLVYINENFAAVHGYKPKELFGKNLKIFHTTGQLKHVKKLLQKIKQAGGFTAEEVWHKHKSGLTFPMLMSGRLVRDGKGKPLLMTVTAIDITEHRQVEEEIRKSEEKYRTLLENMKDMVYSVDAKGNFTYMSPIVRRYGFEPKEFISKNFLDFVHPDDRKRILVEFLKTIKEKKEFVSEFRVLDKKGNIVWIEENGGLKYDQKGKIIGLFGILRDVTERRRVEEHMVMLSMAVEQEVGGVAVADLDGNIIFTNNSWKKMYGIKNGKGMRIEKCIVAKERPFYAELIKLVKIQKSIVRGFKCRGNTSKIFPCLLSLVLLQDEKGRPFAILHTFQDISEQRAHEQTLRHARDKLAKAYVELQGSQKKLKQQFDITRRFNKLMVGREIKMKDLKQKIKELEARLGEG